MSTDLLKSKSNILWIFGDQHRAQALSCNGDPNVNTPNIDLLANQGLNFDRAVCGFPLCCPFRGSLLTGLYPHKCVPGHEYPLNPDQPTIANVFNEAGYQTAYFGKWHLDGWHESNGRAAMHIVAPERRGGFKYWLGYDNNNSQWDCWMHGGDGINESHFRLPGYETDILTDYLIEYLNKSNENEHPFFAVLSVQPPHDPYIAPPEFINKHNPANLHLRPNVPAIKRIEEQARRELSGYYAQIENLDWNLGRIQKALEELGLIENTRIMFFSDHGDMHGSHGQFRKTNPYEEALRIPFIIGKQGWYYDWAQTGRISAPINHVDIAPTTLGLCNINKPDWMEGTDYSHYAKGIKNSSGDPDSAYIQSVIPTGHGDSIDKPWRGIVTADGWKYVCFKGVSWLMFDLNEDLYEQNNLAHNTRYLGIRKKLIDRLQQWVHDTGDCFELPNY